MMKHFVATAYIIAIIDRELKVLLHKHKKLGIWIGIGGHVERDEDPLETLFREVEEETGLSIEVAISKSNQIETHEVRELPLPEVILVEKIPPFGKEPAHVHIDFIYFAVTSHPELLRMKEDFMWVSLSALEKLIIPREVDILAKRAFMICCRILSIK